ncbi:hypothetical protein [Kitasatospora sp. NPDC093102]|uniref:hypothetical protein n=1 Tax=Kitasatospora sp. NPDC093102 TaxID=3155069 RepID=UPI00341C46AA
MDTLLSDDLAPPTAALLREAPWLDETSRRSGRFEVLDQAVLGGIQLLLVGAGGDPAESADGSRWFVPVFEDAPGRAATGTAAFDRAVVDALRDGLRLPTRRGNVIEFHGEPAAYRGQLPFDPGWCSNALSLLDLGGTAHAHKTYRRVSVGTREPELLRLMSGSGRTQQPVGDYSYVDTASGRREPLGVVYRYAEGEGLNIPLRTGIRSLWPLLHAGADPETAVAASQQALAAPLRATGRFLRDFHRDLAERLGPYPEFPVAGWLAETAERLAALTPLIRADARFPVPAREAAVRGLGAELGRIAELPPRPWPSGPCHGDLHLSHVVRLERPDASWELCVIDLSTGRSDPADPGTAQSPWQDLAALRRGIEIFTADEFADHAAETLGLDPEDTCRTALLQTADVAPDTPGWTAERLAGLKRLRRAAGMWAERVGDLLVGGDPDLAGHPAWRLFRLRRLLHELDYAYAHDRAYHAAINLRHAVEAGGLPAAR